MAAAVSKLNGKKARQATLLGAKLELTLQERIVVTRKRGTPGLLGGLLEY